MTNSPVCKSDYKKLRMGRRQIRVRKDFLRFAGRIDPGEKRLDGLRGPFNKVSSASTSKVFNCKIIFRRKCLNLFLKQHLYRSSLDYLKHLVRPSRTMREFKASLMLEKNGISTPPIIATGTTRTGIFGANNFLITANLDNAKSLYLWFGRDLPANDLRTLGMHRLLIRQLGEMVGKMHAQRIYHGDLRPGNVFAENVSGKWRFFLLDNERTAKLPYLPRRMIVKNLVQIGMLHGGFATRTDRLRFFKSYLAKNVRFAGQYRQLAKDVYLKTEARMQKKTPLYDLT